MASRILDNRNAVLAHLVQVLNDQPGVTPEAAYTVADSAIDMGDARLVRVFPAAYRDAERTVRRRLDKEQGLVVTYERLYTGRAQADAIGGVPPAWVDAEIEWVETYLFNTLNTKGERDGDLLADRFRIITCEVSTVYDPDRLHASKLFWSMLELTYQEQGLEA